MDRETRRANRTRRRARRAKAGAAITVALAVAAVAVSLTTGLGQAQDSPGPPKPEVDQVDLTPQPAPIAAGWEGQVGTDANLVAVQWDGDQNAAYTFDVRNGRGEWREAAETQLFDNGPDAGTQDAAHVATPESKNVSEPVWLGKDVTGVRVRLDDGSAQDVTLHVIDSTRGKKPTTNIESTGTPTSPTTTPAPTTPAPPSNGAPPLRDSSEPAPSGRGDGPIGSTPATSTTPAEQGIGLGQGLAGAALASLGIAFVVRRRRVLAVVMVVTVMLVACAPAKKGPGGGAIPGEIVSRSTWGGDLPWACPGGPEYAFVGAAIVHHTVNSNSYAPGASVGIIRGIWAYHVLSLGYCDIAYNFIIDNYGTPFEGRRGGIDQPVVGAHSLNFNRGTTGIAMLGTFSSVTPSIGALGTLQDLIRWKFKVHGVNPFDDAASDILGHRDVFPTECPGQALYNYLPFTRHSVKAGW
jgi:hypothetical protein